MIKIWHKATENQKAVLCGSDSWSHRTSSDVQVTCELCKTILAKNETKMGVKYDTGKLRWDLLPLKPIEELVAILTFGSQKYAPEGWRTVEDPLNRYYAAMMRHIVAYRSGEVLDPESKLPHLAHAMCNLLFIMELSKKPTP